MSIRLRQHLNRVRMKPNQLLAKSTSILPQHKSLQPVEKKINIPVPKPVPEVAKDVQLPNIYLANFLYDF